MSGQPIKIILKSSELAKSSIWATHRQSERLVWPDSNVYRSRASHPSEVKKAWSNGSTSLSDTNGNVEDKNKVNGGNGIHNEGMRLGIAVEESGCTQTVTKGSETVTASASESTVPVTGVSEVSSRDDPNDSTIPFSPDSSKHEGSSWVETPDCTLYDSWIKNSMVLENQDSQSNGCDGGEYDNSEEIAEASLTVLVPSTPSQLDISTSSDLDISIIPGTQETQMSFPSASNSLESSDILVECTPLKQSRRNATQENADLSFIPESQGEYVALDTIYESDNSSQGLTTEESEPGEVSPPVTDSVNISDGVQAQGTIESIKTIDSLSTTPSESPVQTISLRDEAVFGQIPEKQLNSTFISSPFPMKVFSRTDMETIKTTESRHPLLYVGQTVEEGHDPTISTLNETFIVKDNESQTKQEMNVTFSNGSAHCIDANIDPKLNTASAGDSADSDDAETNKKTCGEAPENSTHENIPKARMAIENLIPDIPRKGKKQYDLPEIRPVPAPTPPPAICSSDSEIEYPTPKRKTKITAVRRNRDTKAELEALYDVENPKPSTSAPLVRHENRIAKMLSEKIAQELMSPRSVGPSRAERMATRKKVVLLAVPSPSPLSRRKRRIVEEESLSSVDERTNQPITLPETEPESSCESALTLRAKSGKIELPTGSPGSNMQESFKCQDDTSRPLDTSHDSEADRKSLASAESTSQSENTETAEDTEQSAASSPAKECKRKRGRPRLNPVVHKPAVETTHSVVESRPKVTVPRRLQSKSTTVSSNTADVVATSSVMEETVSGVVESCRTKQGPLHFNEKSTPIDPKMQLHSSRSIEKPVAAATYKNFTVHKPVITYARKKSAAIPISLTLATPTIDPPAVVPLVPRPVVAIATEEPKSDATVDVASIPADVESDDFPIESLEAEPLFSFEEENLDSPDNIKHDGTENDITSVVFNFPTNTPLASPHSKIVEKQSPGAPKLELMVSLSRPDMRDLKRPGKYNKIDANMNRSTKRRKNSEPPEGTEEHDLSPPELELEVNGRSKTATTVKNKGKRTREPSVTRKEGRTRAATLITPQQPSEDLNESSPELVRRSKRLRKPKHFGQDFFSMR